MLLQLVQDGSLSLDETIGSYVPGMPNGDIAALRQVADMTSGIPSYTEKADWEAKALADPTREWTPDELIDVARNMPAKFAPGAG